MVHKRLTVKEQRFTIKKRRKGEENFIYDRCNVHVIYLKQKGENLVDKDEGIKWILWRL